ncbi:MAG: glycosyltransferase 87 family protein [Acidobacteriota bacterium]
MNRSTAASIAVLFVLLAHGLYLPVWEGPDEPFHLARVVQAATARSDGGGAGSDRVPGSIVASIRHHPCGPDLQRAFGCPAFASERAAWNALTSRTDFAAAPVDNYQDHQPPLAYALASLAISSSWPPERQLLILRLCALGLVAVGLLLMRRTFDDSWYLTALALLLLPGAAESLIRVSNDVALFAWCAGTCWLLQRREPGLWSAVVVGLGSWIKMTAAPVLAFAILSWWQRGRRLNAAVSAGVASLVLVVQSLRGWRWGGTLELNTQPTAVDSAATVVLGIGHSALTFLKTAVWLGGWSVFRPPLWILALGLVVAIGWVRSIELERRLDFANLGREMPHLIACSVAAAGFIAFSIGKRHLFGVWGAVGGWYLWAWLPWILAMMHGVVRFRPSRSLVRASWSWIAALNLAWLHASWTLYGGG